MPPVDLVEVTFLKSLNLPGTHRDFALEQIDLFVGIPLKFFRLLTFIKRHKIKDTKRVNNPFHKRKFYF